MASDRAKVLGGAVVALALVQVFVEDVLVFLGATGGAPGSIPPLVYVVIPAAISLLLVVVLLGWALFSAELAGPSERFRE